MIFQGLSVARNCLRPEAAHLTILAIKRGLLYNSPKTFKGHSFSITKFDNLIFFDILHFEINFGNLH